VWGGGRVAPSRYGPGMGSGLTALLFPALCPGCGARAEPVCDRCRRRMPPARPGPPLSGLDGLLVAFAYTGTARELIARAKYRRRQAALPFLATELARRVREEVSVVDLVTWAPTTAPRRRERGFDHAEVLARGVGAALARPVVPTLRRVGREAQTGRLRAERLDGPGFATLAAGRVAGRAVLLVDDVVTTGATLTRAARELRAAGADRVTGAAVARRS
jgi:competence protein ComFC